MILNINIFAVKVVLLSCKKKINCIHYLQSSSSPPSLRSWLSWLAIHVYHFSQWSWLPSSSSTRSRLKKSKANCKPSSPVHLPPPGKHHRRDCIFVESTEGEEFRCRRRWDGIRSHKNLWKFPLSRSFSRWRSGGCNARPHVWYQKAPAGKESRLSESTLCFLSQILQ